MPSATPKMEKSVARSGIEKDANRIETGGRDRRDVKTRSGCGGQEYSRYSALFRAHSYKLGNVNDGRVLDPAKRGAETLKGMNPHKSRALCEREGEEREGPCLIPRLRRKTFFLGFSPLLLCPPAPGVLFTAKGEGKRRDSFHCGCLGC